MTRFPALAAALGVAALLAAGTASAADQPQGKKQKKKATPESAVGAIVGTIAKVSDDGKTFTVTSLTPNKKQPPTTTEFKVTDKTSIEYVAIAAKEDQKLAAGYAVLVAFDGKDKETATVIKAA